VPRCLLVFEPPDGGVAENVMRLALGLGDHGWEAWVAGPGEAIVYPALDRADVPTARLAFARGFGHPRRDAAALRKLLAVIGGGEFDVVHAHSAKAGVVARLAARAKRLPVVYSPHCFPFVGPWGLPRRTFSTAIERSLGRSTDAIICVAEEERRLAIARQIASPERLHVVHNGSGPCEGDLSMDPELQAFADEGPTAGCLTVLRPQKAVHVFLDAAPIVLERLPGARLAVIGNGDLGPQLRERARALGLDRRVRFFDFLAPASRQLRSLDLFVLPSAWEAFPISILEAMACGVPQVATDVGGTSEAIADGKTGLLCPAGDPRALADRIVALLGDPARRRQMEIASRTRHAERFRLDLMVQRTASVYDGVVRDRARPRDAR